jgi:hypothetical protein
MDNRDKDVPSIFLRTIDNSDLSSIVLYHYCFQQDQYKFVHPINTNIKTKQCLETAKSLTKF